MPTPEELLREERQYYLDFLKSLVQLIAQRNQFLLVFQSMLFGALGVLIGKNAFFPLWVIILLGLVVSVVWLYVNAVSFTNEAWIENELKKIDERYRNVVRARQRYWFLAKGNSSKIITFFFPTIMVFTWLIVLAYYFA